VYLSLAGKKTRILLTWREGLQDLKKAVGGVGGAVSLRSGCRFRTLLLTGLKLPSFRSIPNMGYRSRFDVMITKYCK
jgi:hypothetical protein